MKAAVGIGDVLTAVDALEARGATPAAIAQMCGLELRRERTAELQDVPDIPDDDLGPSPDLPEVRLELDIEPEILPPSVRRLSPESVGTPVFEPAADPLESRPRDASATTRFVGLLRSRDATDALISASSALLQSGDLDVDRLVEELARARPLETLPLLRRPSLGLGVQVLVDVGDSMEPFFDDQEDLLRRLDSLFRGSAETAYFATDPNRGVGPRRRRSRWKPHRAPRRGTPVLVLGDLGCGFPPDPAATGRWVQLGRRLARRRSRLVAFAPVRPSRIPAHLRRWATVVSWDRSAGRRIAAHLLRGLDG